MLEGLKRSSEYPSRDGVHPSRLKKAVNDERGDNVLSRVRKVPTKVKDRVLVAVDCALQNNESLVSLVQEEGERERVSVSQVNVCPERRLVSPRPRPQPQFLTIIPPYILYPVHAFEPYYDTLDDNNVTR